MTYIFLIYDEIIKKLLKTIAAYLLGVRKRFSAVLVFGGYFL